MELQELRERNEQYRDFRKPYESVWDTIIEQLYTDRWGWWENRDRRGQRHSENVFDSYPLQALHLMSDGIQGHMVSDSFRWFDLNIPDRLVMNTHEAKRWLQETTDQMYYEFQRSNFYEVVNEFLQDGGSIGTATIYAQDSMDGQRVVFRVMHPKEVAIAENADGQVDTHFREFYMSAKQAYERFGSYHENIEWAIRNDPTMEVHILHAVYPRAVFKPKSSSQKDMPYASEYVDLTNDVKIRTSGYRKNPFATWRWRKFSHETYGRSPAWEVLKDIEMLNEIGRTMILAAQRHVDPPLFVPGEMKNTFNRVPGSLNYYMDPNRIPFALQERSNYPIGQEREEQKRQAIREAFKVDFFLMLQQAEREMTATEVVERQNEKVAVLGSIIGRFQSEALNPIIDLVYDLAMEAGRMPEPPAVVTEFYGGKNIDVDYNGPLAQSMRRLRVQGDQAALNVILPISQIDPTILDRFNLDAVAKNIAESYGMRQDAIRPDKEVEKIRSDRAQQMQQQQQMDKAEAVGRTVRDTGSAIPESKMTELLGGGQ